MRLTDVPKEKVVAALQKAGLSEVVAVETATDMLSDTYWNDPKCAARRVQMEGGNRARFFDALKKTKVNWD